MGRLHVRVQPGARRTAWIGWFGDLPKLAVAAPPVDGAANMAVIDAIAVCLGVRPRHVRLIGGATSRTKRFEIDGLDDDEIRAILERSIPR
jgi:uncharacterized protein